MNNRKERAKIATKTLEIIQQGFYLTIKGKKISIKKDLDSAINNTILFTPLMFDDVFLKRREIFRNYSNNFQTNIEVNNETTLKAAKRLKSEKYNNIICLNFASGKNPGGGFKKGDEAQEESLARSSCLYPCIAQKSVYYDSNRRLKSSLYTDYIIYSPNVPVFRDDLGNLLENPFNVSFITAPAVKVVEMRKKEPQNLDKIDDVMKSRMEKILSIALIQHADALVLGAWGCGIFENDPNKIAGYFYDYLDRTGLFYNKFRKIVFAVLDESKKGLFDVFHKKFNYLKK